MINVIIIILRGQDVSCFRSGLISWWKPSRHRARDKPSLFNWNETVFNKASGQRISKWVNEQRMCTRSLFKLLYWQCESTICCLRNCWAKGQLLPPLCCFFVIFYHSESLVTASFPTITHQQQGELDMRPPSCHDQQKKHHCNLQHILLWTDTLVHRLIP